MADALIPLAPRGAPLPLQTQATLATPDRSLQGAPLPLDPQAPTPASQAAQARHVAEEFETVFLNQMLAPMFNGLSTDGLGGGGVGEEMFRPMLIERYAQAISQAGGVGISEQIVRELTRMQTASASAPSSSEQDDGPRR